MSGTHTKSSLFSDEELAEVARDDAEIKARKASFDAAFAAKAAELAVHSTVEAVASHGRSALPLAMQAAQTAGVPGPVLAALAVLEALLEKLSP